MSSEWSNQIRYLRVNLIDYHDLQKWALIEVIVELRISSVFRPNEVQIGLYTGGQEIAIGQCDAGGKWKVRVEGLSEAPSQMIFEAQARISLGRARNESKITYQVSSQGRTKAKREEALAIPAQATPNPELQLCLPEMVRIKAGHFWMGRSALAHRVRFTRSLSVAIIPVTQNLYELIMHKNPSRFKGARRPVENVSFWQALEFCNRLSTEEGLTPAYTLFEDQGRPAVDWIQSSTGYRLPTEAEWEYIAKSGTESSFSGGNQLDEVGWYQGNAYNQTHTVGKKKSNEWGLYDLSGNVWEWCFDNWDADAYQGRKGELHLDPVISEKGYASKRVRRGGCWLAFPSNCTAHHRFWMHAHLKADDTGFRIVRSL